MRPAIRARASSSATSQGTGVVSLLDAGIWRAGEVSGVVCAESVGARREWTTDEQLFAGSIADLAAAVLTHENLARARAQLEESEELFSRALRSSPDWISVVRMSDGLILHVNEAFERESGHSAAESIGRSTMDLGMWVSAEQRLAWIDRLQRDGLVRDHEVEFRKKSGELRTFLLSGHVVDIRGAECVVTISRDVTDRRRQERLLQDIARGVGAEVGESFFRSLVEHLGRLLEADLAFVGELVGTDVRLVRTIAAANLGQVHDRLRVRARGLALRDHRAARGVCLPEQCRATLSPRPRARRQGHRGLRGRPAHRLAGQPLGLLAVLFKRPLADAAFVEDVLRIFAARASAELERQQHYRAVHHLAHHDPLTGLPNRLHMRRRLDAGFVKLKAEGRRGALLLIDLDRFKEVNDTLGHNVGDRLLARVAQRLDAEMRSFGAGEVARLGGDEFAIWIENLESTTHAQIAAAHAHAAVVAPIDVDGLRLELGASIGIALAPEHADSPSGLMRCADVAMYSAKERFENLVLYEAALDPYTHERLLLLSELAEGVRRREIVAHFQPRVLLADGRVDGFEALARWQHPRLGLLPPARFIPLAELSDSIRPLTMCMLDAALARQADWGSSVKVAVNLSARHLLDEACPEQVRLALARHRADASCLELEITESALIHDPDRARHVLEAIAALGVRLSIDDFGTGYSSLSHLKRMPLNALKIDSSFVGPMLANSADHTIVASTVALARSLGLGSIAEGIEDGSHAGSAAQDGLRRRPGLPHRASHGRRRGHALAAGAAALVTRVGVESLSYAPICTPIAGAK